MITAVPPFSIIADWFKTISVTVGGTTTTIALLAPREFVDPGLGKVKTALLEASLVIRLLFNGMTTKPEELSATYA